MDFKKGDIIDGLYEVLSDPMVSFHSTVWKVHHKTLDVDMAMKQPFTGEKPSASDKRAYKARCRKWADLGMYAHIVQCYNVREIDGELLVFSEWCGGGSLSRLITEGKIYEGNPAEVERRIVGIAVQILNALVYAETSHKTLVHGAVTPYNIHVGSDGFIKISDFAYTHIDPIFRTPENYTPVSDCYQWALVVLAMLNKGWDWKDGANKELICEAFLDCPEKLKVNPKSELISLLKTCLIESTLYPEAALYQLGLIYQDELSDSEEAILTRVYRNPRDRIGTLNNMALACIENGSPEKATSFWEKALKYGSHPDTLHNLELFADSKNVFSEHYTMSAAPSKDCINKLYKRFIASLGLFFQVCNDGKDYDTAAYLLDEINKIPYYNISAAYYTAQNSLMIFAMQTGHGITGFSITPIKFLPICSTHICTNQEGTYIAFHNAGKPEIKNIIEIWTTSPLAVFRSIELSENTAPADFFFSDNEHLCVVYAVSGSENGERNCTVLGLSDNSIKTDKFSEEKYPKPEIPPFLSIFCNDNKYSLEKNCYSPYLSCFISAENDITVLYAATYSFNYSQEKANPEVVKQIEWLQSEEAIFLGKNVPNVSGNSSTSVADKTADSLNEEDEELPEINEPEMFETDDEDAKQENITPQSWVEVYDEMYPRSVPDEIIPGLAVEDRFLLNEIPSNLTEALMELSGIVVTNPAVEFRDTVKQANEWNKAHTTAVTESLIGAEHFNPDVRWALNSSDDEYSEALKEVNRRARYWNNQSECDLLTLLSRALRERARKEETKKIRLDIPTTEHIKGADKRRTQYLPQLVERVRKMRAFLLSRIKGQDHVIHSFCDAMFNAEVLADADEKRKRPRAVFTFAGPPGVGKTLLAETAAKYFNLPFKRFDMTEYSADKSHLGLIGFEATWKDSAPGQLTTFVRENPHCVLLFDEIEKAHSDVIRLFYQILDAGILTDKHDSTHSNPAVKAKANVSFKDTIIIFTSNAGRSLYEEQYKENCAAVPTQVLINALRNEIDPQTNAPFFPSAIVSRIATGYPLLFNNLKPHDLVEILGIEYHHTKKLIEKQYGIEIRADKDVMLSLLFAKGGATDARQLRASVAPFFKKEILKILTGTTCENKFDITDYRFTVDTEKLSGDVRKLFRGNDAAEILIYSNKYTTDKCEKYLDGSFIVHPAHTVDEAIEIAGKQNIALVLLDIAHRDAQSDGLSTGKNEKIDKRTMFASMAASAWTDGKKLFKELSERLTDLPIYILENNNTPIADELIAEFERVGARGKLKSPSEEEFIPFTRELLTLSRELYMQKTAEEMAASHKILAFETAPSIIDNSVVIELRNFEIKRSYETNDASDILSDAEKPDTRFNDIIGAERAKQELRYFVKYLQNPKQFAATGAKIPKGALLYGNPGTGKTMLAKALAGESNVTYIPAKASNFVNGIVGSGPAAIRELFAKARRYAPSIIFIDEVDTIGRMRTGSNSGSREYEETLNALLAEMDGFAVNPKRPVFVLAATNYNVAPGHGIGVLDEAFMRRFDSKIKIELPDKSERLQLLKMLLSKISSHTVSDEGLENIAERSVGLSPAMLTNVFQTAFRMVTAEAPLSDQLLDEALETTIFGEKKDWGKASLERTARHECGHALLSWLAGDTPSYLTIVARGDFGGYMQHADKTLESPTRTKAQLLSLIRTSLGGRAAEIYYYGEECGLDTGSGNDLAKATSIARSMITKYGMSDEIGIAIWDSDTAEESELVRKKVNEILQEELKNAISLIRENEERMNWLVEKLLKENKLTGEEIEAILSAEQTIFS